MTLDFSMVTGTVGGGMDGQDEPFGDGVAALDHSEADVSSCLLSGNERTGDYYDRAKGALSASAVVGNPWAVVVQKSIAD